MRVLPILAAAALLMPLPALAQDADGEVLADAAATLDDPMMQEQAGMMAAMMVGALLEMRVGPLAEAMAEIAGEDAPAIDPDARLADMVGPEAAEAPARVAERVPQMMGAMASLAGAFEEMLPQLREMAARLPRELPRRD